MRLMCAALSKAGMKCNPFTGEKSRIIFHFQPVFLSASGKKCFSFVNNVDILC